jgi:hypothetical protein
MRSLAGDLVPAPFSSQRFLKTRKANSLTRAKWKKVLCAFHRLAETPEKFLQILIALDEIYF